MKLERELGSAYKGADIALSRVFMDFSPLMPSLKAEGVFENVYDLDERREESFPELAKYRENYGNIIKHTVNRIIFTKKFARCVEQYINVDFKKYQDIYVFCDSDPIGYYLNYKKIQYHALEDGLDCLANLDDAYVANASHFKFKTWLSRRGLIFIMNGWGRYCIDMEINDRKKAPTDCPRFVEVPRKPLEDALTSPQKARLVRVFIPDAESMLEKLGKASDVDTLLYLTEAYPNDEEIRKRVSLDIINKYGNGYQILIKPHPRDMIDYVKLCPDAVVLRGKFPIEVLNFIEGIHIKKAISIVTSAINSMDFVDEKVNLGASFWDAYEDPDKHAFNKKVGLSMKDA